MTGATRNKKLVNLVGEGVNDGIKNCFEGVFLIQYSVPEKKKDGVLHEVSGFFEEKIEYVNFIRR